MSSRAWCDIERRFERASGVQLEVKRFGKVVNVEHLGARAASEAAPLQQALEAQ